VPALAKARPNSDPCGRTLKVIVQSKKLNNFLVYWRKFGYKIKMVHLYNLLFTFNQATSQTCYLVNFKNFKPANVISLFVWRNLPLCSQNSNIKSIWELCVVSHCVLFIITNVRVLHERGDRLCPIGPFSLKPDVPKTLLSCGQQLPLSPQGRSVKVKWSLLSRPKETRRTFSLPSN